MRRALIVSSSRGLGHVTRCRALACELGALGWRCTLTDKSPLSASSYDFSVVDVEGEEYEHEVYAALSGRPLAAIIDTPHAVDADLVVCGTVGVRPEHFPLTDPMWKSDGKVRVFAVGESFAILRPEFRERRLFLEACLGHISLVPPSVLDLREIRDRSASQIAADLYSSVVHGDDVITYGGMRALEAACVRHGAEGMEIEARNRGEALNKVGLLEDPRADLIDGLGARRVALAMEALA